MSFQRGIQVGVVFIARQALDKRSQLRRSGVDNQMG